MQLKTRSSIRDFILKPGNILVVYILFAIIASIQLILVGPHVFEGRNYTDYNNYVIFRQSFFHLLDGKNIYMLYPAEQWDLYKYSPTFALVMGLLAHLPDVVGPDKIKFIAYSAFWMLLFAVMPLVVTSFHILVWQYHNWMAMMAADQSASYGLSVMGWLHNWFGINSGKSIVSIIGIILFLVPLSRWQLYKNEGYKLMMLAFMLIWVIIFNHKAESPTYIIAVAGAGIWYFSKPVTTWHKILLAFIFVFTCLSPTDIFPPYIRQHFFIPYTIKAIPCILLWCIIWIELMTVKNNPPPVLENI